MNAAPRRSLAALLFTLALAQGGGALALTCQSNANGNWNAAGTWTGCGGGTPGAADDVEIRNANTVTIPAGVAAVANSVTFTASNGTANLTHAAASSSLTVGAGGVTINSPGNNNTKNWNINAGSAAVNGALGMNGGGNPSRRAVIVITTGSLDISGNLTMTAASAARTEINLSGGAGNLFIGGSFTLASGNGTLTPGASSTVTFDSATTPVTVATGSSVAYHHLAIAKGGGNVANAATTGNLAVGGNLTVTSGTFNLPGITATVTGTTGVSGTLGFITSAAGTKTFTGDVTIAVGGSWTNNTVNAPATLGGSFTNNGTFTSGSGVYTFAGAAAQSLTGTNAGTTTFGSLTLNNASGLSLTGTHDVTVTTLLTLTAGAVTTNANVLTIANGSAIASAGGADFVIGNLRKTVGAGGCNPCAFELGTTAGGNRYAPVTAMTFNGLVGGGSVTAATTASEHPNLGASAIDGAASVNRYWTLAASGLTFTDFGATFNWNNADEDGGADDSVFEMQRYSPPAPAAGTWSATTAGTRADTSIQVSGVAGFGDFAVGQPLAVAGGIGRFNAYDTTTAAGAVTGFITTKVAGPAFNVDIVALRNNRKNIDTGFTGTVTVQLLDASDNSGTLDTATACNSSWAVIQTLAPDPVFVGGDNGRRTIAITEGNAWREARIRVSNLAGTLVGCSTDAFAIRPASLTVSVTDATWDTAGTARVLDNGGASGGNVHKAGQPFTITAAASPVSATNYDGTPTVSALMCSLPGTCVNGTLTLGAFSGAGSRATDTATYSEAGAFSLTLVDQDYAVIDSFDGTPADCTAAGRYVCQSPAPATVGRFVPDRFAVTAVTQPVFRTFDTDDGSCSTPSRTFTYVGQPFGYQTAPAALITAQDAAGNTTTNYRGTLWKLTSAGVTQAFANAPAETLDSTGILAATVAETPDTGTGTLTANAGDKLAFARDTTSPRAPFNAVLSLTWSVSDASENGAGQGIITTASPLVFNGGGSGVGFDGGVQFRYGRLRLANANGSQLVPLLVPMEAQYYSGAPANAFLTNTADHCTSIAAADIALGAYTGNLSDTPACETAVSGGGTFAAGRRTFLLAAPGSANNGSVTLTANLGAVAAGNTCLVVGDPTPDAATTANRPYLQGNWTTGTFTQNPAALATFGVYRGSEEVIDIRETFTP